MKTFILMLVVLTQGYLALVGCSEIEQLKATLAGINAWLESDTDIIARLGGRFSIRHIPQLDNQASSCANWFVNNPDKEVTASPQFKNKDANVIFVPERFYKDHANPDNAGFTGDVAAGADQSKASIHSKNYTDSKQAEAAALSNLMNDESWIVTGIKDAGLSGIGGSVKDHNDYFLVVFAMQVHIYQKNYHGKTPQNSIPLFALDPPISDNVEEDDFKPMEDDESVKGVQINPERTLENRITK